MYVYGSLIKRWRASIILSLLKQPVLIFSVCQKLTVKLKTACTQCPKKSLSIGNNQINNHVLLQLLFWDNHKNVVWRVQLCRFMKSMHGKTVIYINYYMY